MKRILYLAIITFSFISCENEIPFDIKENPQKLILNALIDADKEENEIILGLTGRDKTDIVYEGSVDIYINGVHKEHLLTIPSDLPDYGYLVAGVVKTHLRFSPDDTIRIEARTDDGKHYAWAEVVVPHPVAIEKIDTSQFSTTTWSSLDTYLRVKTTFTDDTKKANYYRILMRGNLEIEAKEIGASDYEIFYETFATPLIVREDVVLTDGRPSVDEEQGILTPVENIYGVFDDSRINGTYTMTTSLLIPYAYLNEIAYYNYYWGSYKYDDVKQIGISVKVKLLSISKDYYLYLKAANIGAGSSEDDYFSLPVKFHSNVEGGTGIVGVSIGSEVTIHLEDYIPRK